MGDGKYSSIKQNVCIISQLFYRCVWLETDTTHPSVIRELVVGKPDLEMDYVEILADFTKR